MAAPAQADLSAKATQKPAGSKLSANKDASWWTKEIARSVRDWKDYRDRGRKIIERYRDDRKDVNNADERTKRFNILYSNTETLGPAIYSQMPMPDIRRRFQDDDPVGRVAANVLQRAVAYCLQSYDFDGVLERCRQDYLLPGFAVARVLYKPYFKQSPAEEPPGEPDAESATAKASTDAESPAEDGGEGEEEPKPEAVKQPTQPNEQLIYQEVATEYVPWDKFAMSRSRTYEKVWWGAIADDLTRDEVTAQFGANIANQLSYTRKDTEVTTYEPDEALGEGKARIWEVWNKRGRGRFCVAEGFNDWVKAPEADPLRLEGFFPWPKPLWSIPGNNTLEPIPEFCQYQDQATELDELTERIDILTAALRRRGVYDAAFKDELGAIVNGADNDFVPLNNFQQMTEKGGLAALVAEMPIDGIAKVIAQLVEQREAVKQTIYEVTGISDIIRGATKPSETATAQQIKGQWAGLRVSVRQKKFAAFARDIVRLKAEVISERFDPQTLSLMSGVQLPTNAQKQQFQQLMQSMQAQQQRYQQIAQQAQQQGMQPPPPPPQMQPPDQQTQQFMAQPSWEDVLQVLRNDKLRGFKVDIETDSTVQPDADAEKQARTELLTAIGQFSQQMAPAVQMGFMPVPLAVSLIKFALRSFKVDSEVEQELDGMGQDATPPQMKQMQEQLQQREQAVQQAEGKAKDQQHQADMARKDAELASERAQRKEGEAASKQTMLDMALRHAEEMKGTHEKHRQEMLDLFQRAQDAAAQLAPQMAQPQPQPVQPAPVPVQ